MKRNKFNLSHYNLMTGNMGVLYPVGLFEALPGDTIQQATSLFVRVAPMLAPIMHPVQVRIHHFFVPFRLIWDDWEDFITGGKDGLNASVHPYKTKDLSSASLPGTIWDYLGVSPGASTGVGTRDVNVLPLRAYCLIYNEFYRDSQLGAAATISTASGADSTTTDQLLSCAWERDYFTTARPSEELGPQVVLPWDGAPIVMRPHTQTTNAAQLKVAATGAGAGSTALWSSGGNNLVNSTATTQLKLDPNGTLEVDGSGSTVNDLRTAFALQRLEEARARFGSRYTEYLRYLGVRSSDARLQRPEYLGGGRQTLQFSEVLQTGPDSTDAGVGDLRGHGIGAMRSARYRRFFEEHGYVMSILSVRPKSMYSQSTARMFWREVKEDYHQRELEGIGQMPVTNKEVFVDAAGTADNVFGYQNRYEDYRTINSRISGEFRNVLDYWHMGRDYATPPTLNGTFLGCNPTDRVYASTTTDQLYVMAQHSIQARRLMGRGNSSFVR